MNKNSLSLFQRFAIFVAVILVAALAATVLQGFRDPTSLLELIGTVLGQINQHLYLKFAAGAVSVFLIWIGVLLAMALFGIRSSGPREIRIEADLGPFKLGLDVVEDFLQKRVASMSGIRDLKVRVDTVKNGIVVYGEAQLDLSRPVPTFAAEFQKLVRHEMLHSLGIDRVADVYFRVREINARATGSPLAVSESSSKSIVAEEPTAYEQQHAVSYEEPAPEPESAYQSDEDDGSGSSSDSGYTEERQQDDENYGNDEERNNP